MFLTHERERDLDGRLSITRSHDPNLWEIEDLKVISSWKQAVEVKYYKLQAYLISSLFFENIAARNSISILAF